MDLADRPRALAAELLAAGARFTIVGGLAKRLRGLPHRPRDLDIAVAETDLDALRHALEAVGASVPVRLRSGSRCTTAWGCIDVFIGEVRATHDVQIDGHPVRIAT